jgi:hypothetical protein
VRALIGRLLSRLLRRRPAPPPPRPDDPDRLLRVYRETEAEVQRLRRAA